MESGTALGRIEDKMTAALTNAFAKTVATPGAPVPQEQMPPAAQTAQTSPTPPAAAPVEPSTPAGAAPATAVPPTPAEIDLESIDLDAEAPATPVVAAPAEGQPPAAGDKEAWQELQAKIESGDLNAIESAMLRTGRGKQMLESFKRDRELLKPMEDGGIGRRPTLEEIREGDGARNDVMAMRYEFEANPKNFVANVLGLKSDGTSYFGGPQSVEQVLYAIPQALAEVANTPAGARLMQAYTGPVMKSFVDQQYNNWSRQPATTQQDVDIKARALDALQMVEYLYFGKARDVSGLVSGQPAAQTSMSPEVQELRARAEAAERQLQQQGNQRQTQFVSQVQNTIRTNALADIDKVLTQTGIAKSYPEALLGPLKQDLYNKIEGMVQGNPNFQRYQIQLEQTARSGGSAEQPASTYRGMFRTILQTHPDIKNQLTSLVTNAATQANARVALQAEAQQRTEPTSGTPAPTSVLPSGLQRQPNESANDFNARRIASGLMRSGVLR